MRIAYVCADQGVPVFGSKGSSVHVQEIIRAFINAGHEVVLFASRFDNDVPDNLKKLKIFNLPHIPKGISVSKREILSIKANKDLYLLIEREGPFDLIYERYSLWSWASVKYGTQNKSTVLLEVNAPLIQEQKKYRKLNHILAAEAIALKIFNQASGLIAVSSYISRYLERYVNNPNKILVQPNGVDPNRFIYNPNSHYRANQLIFTIGFVGTLKPWHGLPVLVETFSSLIKKYPNVRLLIVGDGTEKEKLIEDLKINGVYEKTELTGSVSPHKVPEYISTMDVAVAPYPDSEGQYFSPLKIFEYMACGVPVITTRVGDIRNVINDRINGIFCKSNDPASLCREIESLIESQDMREKIGRNGRYTVCASYTWAKVANNILSFASTFNKNKKSNIKVAS